MQDQIAELRRQGLSVYRISEQLGLSVKEIRAIEAAPRDRKRKDPIKADNVMPEDTTDPPTGIELAFRQAFMNAGRLAGQDPDSVADRVEEPSGAPDSG